MIESPGGLFERLLDIMSRLRGSDGCPWDRIQTRTSLKPYLIEETYELLEAIEGGHPDSVREELGDLLLQVVFHARIGEESGEFGMSDVLESLIDKMIRRHPHVFGDATVTTPHEVVAQWETLKLQEGDERRRSVIDGVPRALPSLLRAQRLQSKAARVHFDWPDARAAWEKVEEEMRETADALVAGDAARLREELGDLLFSVVNVARLSDIDAEDTLREATEKFRRRFQSMEADLIARGTSLGEASQDELERSWQAAKAHERDNRGP